LRIRARSKSTKATIADGSRAAKDEFSPVKVRSTSTLSTCRTAF
jgi:hypothetical protein